MKRILKTMLALIVITSLTAVVDASAPLSLRKKGNPFRSDLKKIEKLEKDIEEAADEDGEYSEKKKKLEKRLKDTKERLSKKIVRLQERTEKELEKLNATLEKEKEKEKVNEKKVKTLEEQIAEKEVFLRSIPAWSKGENPDSEEKKSEDK